MVLAATPANQTDRNYEAFVIQLPQLVSEHPGTFALMHDCQVVDFFANSLEATLSGAKSYGLGNFSVQEVTEEPEHLGFYSYVGGSGTN